MSKCVLICVGMPAWWAPDSPQPLVTGMFLAAYDPAGVPVGWVWVDDRKRAMTFGTPADALACVQQVNPLDPVRPDGLPNRPLAGFTLATEPADDPYAGHRWQRGDRVRVVSLGSSVTRLRVGLTGSVIMTDSLGTIHIRWDGYAPNELLSQYGVQPEHGDWIEPEREPSFIPDLPAGETD